MTTLDGANQWEDLRREARQLENDLEAKLSNLAKVGSSYAASRSSDRSPLLGDEQSTSGMFEALTLEAEQVLAKLTLINDRMSESAQRNSLPANASTVLHTLQRHRDILQDYSHELQRTQANYRAHREREDLLGSVRRDISDYKSGSGMSRRTDLYLKEHQHLHNSHRMVDEQISVAMATRENLSTQRRGLQQISSTMQSMANRFPAINNLIQKINFKKRKDAIVLAVVIAVCIILLLIYQFH